MAYEPSPVEQHYCSLEDAAKYLGCQTRTVRRMISRGELTGYRLGPRMLRVDLNELDAALRPVPTAGGDAR